MIVETIFVVLASTIVGTAAGGIAMAAMSHKLDRKSDDYCADCQDAGVCLHNQRCQKPILDEIATIFDEAAEKAREQAMFLAVPSAWWLDPNRWGEDPDWRDRIPAAINPPKPEPTRKAFVKLRCPRCETTSAVRITTEHGGQATGWHCSKCDVDYTRAGETKASIRKSRKAVHAALDLNTRMVALGSGFMSARDVAALYDEDLPEQLQRPPAVTQPAILNPQANYRVSKSVLPCGCRGEIRCGRQPYLGWPFCVCQECGAEWEPPSNGSDRQMAQGETLFRPCDRLWEIHAENIRLGITGAENHGSCPTCRSPIAKIQGEYRCTRQGCRRYEKGWK